jgi:hypothetical protein
MTTGAMAFATHLVALNWQTIADVETDALRNEGPDPDFLLRIYT